MQVQICPLTLMIPLLLTVAMLIYAEVFEPREFYDELVLLQQQHMLQRATRISKVACYDMLHTYSALAQLNEGTFTVTFQDGPIGLELLDSRVSACSVAIRNIIPGTQVQALHLPSCSA
jgi:hypothetical protein